MVSDYLRKCLVSYRKLIYSDHDTRDQRQTASDLARWKDILFVNFLVYCLPISLIAVIPGVYMSIRDGYTPIAVLDITCMMLLTVATFIRGVNLILRKTIVIILFYTLGVFLIAGLGYIGPGVFYLLATTILIALILPVNYAYWSEGVNTIILTVFALLINFKSSHFHLANQYTTGEWVAFSSNLIFIGLVLVLLIHRIFDGLQATIDKKDMLRENYRRIFDDGPIPMWVFATETLKFLNVNTAAVNHYGYSKAEFLNMTLQDIRPKEYRQEIEQTVQLNKEEPKFRKHDVVHEKKGGEVIHVVVESSLLNYKGQQAKLVLATDITAQIVYEQKTFAANQKIKESEASLQAILGSTADGYLLLNDTYKIVAFNDRAKKALLLNKNSLEFVTGENIFHYVEADRAPFFLEVLKKVRGGESVEYQRKFVLEGNKLWVNYTVTPVFEEGVSRGFCVVGRDITAYKNYVETVEAQNKKLRDISWMQSHLVRAPLARIMGLSPLIANCTDEAERRDLLNFLEVSSNDLDDVIKKMTVEATEVAFDERLNTTQLLGAKRSANI